MIWMVVRALQERWGSDPTYKKGNVIMEGYFKAVVSESFTIESHGEHVPCEFQYDTGQDYKHPSRIETTPGNKKPNPPLTTLLTTAAMGAFDLSKGLLISAS